jgi:hypothetical protein
MIHPFRTNYYFIIWMQHVMHSSCSCYINHVYAIYYADKIDISVQATSCTMSAAE